MLRRLYDWTMSLAARKSAEVWLAVIAFVESSIFLVPADVLFLPMALAKPERCLSLRAGGDRRLGARRHRRLDARLLRL
jgi:membrane protein YqaA with SNARE-associated domain